MLSGQGNDEAKNQKINHLLHQDKPSTKVPQNINQACGWHKTRYFCAWPLSPASCIILPDLTRNFSFLCHGLLAHSAIV